MIGGRYSREREVGRGGMGAVWLGRDEVLGRPVAIKRVGLMPGGSSPDLLRAEREARIGASLNHPNVVGVYDLVHDGEQQWLIMEFFSGTTLGDLVRSQGPLTVNQLAPILGQAAHALAAAHEAGIVHRDVKPSNILVREDGHAKITDFGIARARADESLTQTGLVTGSPAYLAPEVASGASARAASDVWSLGATAFHALAGHPPYDVGDNVLGALYRIVNEAPPQLDDAGEMGILLQATMASHPESRWTMTDVVRFLDGLNGRLPTPPVAAPAPVAPAASADGGTQVMATTPPETPATPPEPAPEPAPASSKRADRRAETTRRRVPVLPLLVGALVLALVVVIALLALSDDPQRDTGAADDAPTSTTSSPSESEPPPPSADEMEGFITDYIGTASDDPSAGFEQLTTNFQQASGGLNGYSSFWGKVSNARLQSVTAAPDDLTVTYTYSYNLRGKGKQTDTVSLRLVQEGDTFLIDGEA